VKTIELYPHNQETYDKIQELWKTENKVAAVQATGTGKSYLILKCIYNDPEANKVVLAPSNYILEQLIKEAGEELPNTKTLTYSKLSYMSNAEIKELNIGYIFLDEFHRCGAEQWGDGVQRLLNTFPDAKVLGTSATHIRFLDNARNMGEELFNGNIVNNLSLAEAIVKKILPMPVYISALYTYDNEIDNLKTKVENSKNDEESKKEMLKEIELMKHKLNKSKGIPNILKKHLSKNYNGKFIIFCKDKIHLDEMKETVVDWFKQSKVTKQVDVYSVYSNYEYGDAEVEAFIENKNPKSVKLLFSIEMFNEGIHIEDVTGVILLRPTVSPIIYYQQIGRAMQAGKNNTPVIFDLVNNFDNIGAKNFVEDLEKEVKLKNEKLDKDDNPEDGEEKGYVDISEFMIFDETLEVMKLFSKIEENLIDNWDYMYEQLKEYYKENDNNITKTFDKKLSTWIRTQREFFKLGKLSNERRINLDKLNFVWNMYDDSWINMYELLIRYYKEYGNYDIKINVNKSLYNWISDQRKSYKKGDLEEWKVEKLNYVNFIWEHIEQKWNDNYNILKQFYLTNGHCNVDQYNDIYKWAYTQKYTYNQHKLSVDKIQRLNEINFTWDVLDDDWNKMYNLLIEYTKFNSIYNVSTKLKYCNHNLGRWISIQRKNYKDNKLSKHRIDKLNDVDFIWDQIEFIWENCFIYISSYFKENNNFKIPKDIKCNDIGIYDWMSTQRKNYNKGVLSQPKIEKLNSINFPWKSKIFHPL